jgi:glycine cleavage system H protein
MDIPSDLLYASGHTWVRLDGSRATIGITDYAQLEFGMILYIELPELHDKITVQESFGSVETIEGAQDLEAPLSGRVVAVNTELEREPFKVHTSPYEHGWMIVIELSDPSEAELLWDAERYLQHSGGEAS